MSRFPLSLFVVLSTLAVALFLSGCGNVSPSTSSGGRSQADPSGASRASRRAAAPAPGPQRGEAPAALAPEGAPGPAAGRAAAPGGPLAADSTGSGAEQRGHVGRPPEPARGRRLPPAPDWAPAERELPAPPDGMTFQDYGVNPWTDAGEEPLSTFALDVDTGAYTLARSYILEGSLPPIEAVRVEEFVNYFDADYPSPERGAFAVTLDGAPSPFDDGETLVRVGLEGRRVSEARRRDAVLTFVVDVSGSMEEDGRLELVKEALGRLADGLGPGDEIAVVAYTDDAWVVLPTTRARARGAIRDALTSLAPMGSTNAEAGLRLGYELAAAAFRPEATNRVLLCSDGVANVGATGPEAILEVIGRRVADGITLTTVGVGLGNYNDVLMEQLADRGDGAYVYVDDALEAEHVFVENLTGTLEVIARDAKVQVEFDPAEVEHYRLLGYENRDVDDRDFENDAVDAGEVGAGQSVTALYALRLRPEAGGTLATVRVRYADPVRGDVREEAATLHVRDLAPSFRRAAPRLRLAVAAGAFADLLREGYLARTVTLGEVARVAEDAAADLPGDAPAAELADLVRRAEGLAVAYGR